MTVFHLIAGVGELTIDDVVLAGPGGSGRLYLGLDELEEIAQAGHEIGGHSRTHAHLRDLDDEALYDEVSGDKSALEQAGFNPATFAYPFGEYDSRVRQAVIDAGYKAARGVERGLNGKTADPYGLQIQEVDRDTTIEEARSWINEAQSRQRWLVLVFHRIDNSSGFYGTAPETLQEIIDYLGAAQTEVITVAEGVGRLDQ
jgi:peptidoglycan/xylan/chitin deacetylase (PgdA/CDA1 family)